jgi:protease prsW family protein
VSGVWIARALLALPAHVFFAAAWGYALGRAKKRDPGARFPALFMVATAMHGFYIHFVYARGPATMIVALPVLLAMGVIVWFAARDLRRRDALDVGAMDRLSRVSMELMTSPPSLRRVSNILRQRERRLAVHWIAMGTMVTLGSVVDEENVSTVAPVALLGSGLLAAFPLSGFLIARASSLPTLIEPALATALAIVLVLVLLGAAAPVALVFAAGLSPIAWGLACLGAWLGRPAS